MGTRCWRHRTGVGLALLVSGLLAGVGCEYRAPEVAKLPLQVTVENPGPLRVAVVEASKRPLAAVELPPFQRGGWRWDYRVEFTDTAGVGVQLKQAQATVRSLTGVTTTEIIPLASRVDPRGTTRIRVHAVLSTSNPEESRNLTGVEELTFLGWDDNGQAIRVIVRVPLE